MNSTLLQSRFIGVHGAACVRTLLMTWDEGAEGSCSWNEGAWNEGAWDEGAEGSCSLNEGAWNEGAWDEGAWNEGAWNEGAWN